jgi:formyl-CoA transferase/CoA:oxalate CoA-transferase
VFEGSDRGFAVAVGSEKLWSTFCATIGRADLERHPLYATNALRCVNRAAMEAVLGEVFAARRAAEWIVLLRAAGIPCSLVRTFDEVAEDEQSAVREMFPEVEGHRVTGTPVKMSGTPGTPSRGAPRPGEHSCTVLREVLGMDAAAMDGLVERGIVFAIV